MELLVFLIPFFVSAVLLLFFRKQTTWWEHAILIIPSLLVGAAMIWAFERHRIPGQLRHEDTLLRAVE